MMIHVRWLALLLLVVAIPAAFAADVKISALPAATAVADADEFPANQAGTTRKITLGQAVRTRIGGSSGTAGLVETQQILTANAASNSTTTFAAVMTTNTVGTGWWHFKYYIVTQSGATTTGQKFRVSHSGTVGNAGYLFIYPTTGGAATNDIWACGADATANVMVQHQRAVAIAQDVGPMTDVLTANADCQGTIEGYFEVTASGNLTLDHASEVAAASTVQAGTHMELVKIN